MYPLFLYLVTENWKKQDFCLYFHNARVHEAGKHKCEYIGKESHTYSKKSRMEKEGCPDAAPAVLWNNQFFMFYMASGELGSGK